MRVSYFFLILMIISSSFGVNIRKMPNTEELQIAYTNERLRLVSKQSEISEKLISILQLQIQSSGKVDDTIGLLQSVEQDIENRYRNLLTEYNSLIKQITDQINSSTLLIIQSEKQLKILDRDIQFLENIIQGITEQIEGYLIEVFHLDEREKGIDIAREVDIQDYAKRKFRDEHSMKVLQQIIEKLIALQSRGNSFLEIPEEDIETILRLIPKNDPIRAFAQITSKYNGEKVRNIIKLLASIEKAMQASYVNDRTGEEQSELKYQLLIKEIENLRSDLYKRISELNEQLKEKKHAYNKLLQEKYYLVTLIETNEIIIQQQRVFLLQAKALYENRIQEAEHVLYGVRQALEILIQHSSALSSREKAAESNVLNPDEDHVNMIASELDNIKQSALNIASIPQKFFEQLTDVQSEFPVQEDQKEPVQPEKEAEDTETEEEKRIRNLELRYEFLKKTEI